MRHCASSSFNDQVGTGVVLNIKYRALKAFLLAVETGSFTYAADRLGITQPSFTALIQDLEKVLDLKLFERTTRSITLTDAGKDLLERIRRPVADLEDAYLGMMDLAAVRRGVVVLGTLPSVSLTLVPPTLGELRRGHPGLQIRVVEAHNDELIAMVRTNQVDFAVATLLAQAPDLAFLPLFDDVFCAVYPTTHPVGMAGHLHWQDMVGLDLILLSQGSSARAQFDRAIVADDTLSGLRYDVTHMTTAALLVRQGLGVALLPRLALPALPLDGLCHRPVEDDTAHRTIGVLHRRDRELSPASQACIAQLQQVARTITAQIDASAESGALSVSGSMPKATRNRRR